MSARDYAANCRTAVVEAARYLADFGAKLSVFEAQNVVDQLSKTMEKWQRAEDDLARGMTCGRCGAHATLELPCPRGCDDTLTDEED